MFQVIKPSTSAICWKEQHFWRP